MKLLLFTLVEVVGSLVFPEIQGWTNVTLVDEPFLPTVKELGDMEAPETAARWQFWLFVMLSIGGVTALTGTLILKRAERPEEAQAEAPEGRIRSYALVASVPREHDDDRAIERSGVAFKPRQLKVLLAMSLTFTFSTSFAAMLWSSRTGRLSKDYGADWEVYAGLLACSGLSLVLQAAAMARRLKSGQKFATTAFAQACLTGMAPILSDQYDTMKDILFAFLCLQSEHEDIYWMGIGCLLWLVAIHVFCFCSEDTVAELLASHLAVLLITPATGEQVPFWDEMLVLLYKQLTPTKRFLLLMENLPQGICAMIFLRYEGGSLVVTVLSLVIPAVQIGLTFLLYSRVRAEVAPYFGRRLRALVSAGDQLMAQRIWREADFESDKGLFRLAVAFLHSKEIGAERDDDVISLWKVALAMHDGPSKEQEHWDLSDLGLKELLPLVEAFFAELAAAERQKLGVDLSHNQLGEEGALSLLEALRATSPASTRLDIGGNDIGKGAFALARALRSGEVMGEVAHPIVEFLVELTDDEFKRLEEERRLELKLNGYGDRGERFRRLFEPLCRALRAQLPQLRELRLWLSNLYDAFGDDQARGLALGLQQQKELQWLKLRLPFNSLGPEGAEAVACALGELTELKRLELSLHNNTIRDAGAASVVASLRKLRQLTELEVFLQNTGLGDAGAAAVVEAVRELPQLTKLWVRLQDNKLSKEQQKKLRATFDALPVAKKEIFLDL